MKIFLPILCLLCFETGRTLGYVFITSRIQKNARVSTIEAPCARERVGRRIQLTKHQHQWIRPLLSQTALRAKTSGDEFKEGANKDDNSWLIPLVIPLWLIYVSNQWSRSSIYYLVDFTDQATERTAMNVALHFDESQYALLASVAFTSLFAVASVVLGNAVDQPNFDRKLWTVASAIVWSLAILSTSLWADVTYTSVVASRFLMGVACAVTTPTAYTWIRDVVPQTQAATATSIYGTGVALGSGAASLTLLLDAQVGWRDSMTVIGVAGLLAAAVAAFCLPDDLSQPDNNSGSSRSTVAPAREGDTSRVLEGIRQAVSSERAQWIFLACLFRFSSGLCIGVWSAPFFRSVLSADNMGQYAVAQAAISAVGASVSGVVGGRLADQLSSATRAGVEQRLWVPVVGSLLAAPAWYFAIDAAPESFGLAMTWLAIEYLVAECWFGPTISTLQATVGSSVGGTAQGLFTMTGALANLAPTLVGYFLADSSNNLSTLLSESVCVGYVGSAACFVMAIRASSTSALTDEEED